jgi:hypothetical protein
MKRRICSYDMAAVPEDGYIVTDKRGEVLSEVLAKLRTEISAAAVLGLSTRQTQRLLTAYRDGVGGALINKPVGARRTTGSLLASGSTRWS